MKKTLQHLLCAGLGAAILAATTATAQPTNKPKSTEAKPAKPGAEETPKRDWYPFSATVASVDTNAKTVSIKKIGGFRVLHTDEKTTLEKGDKPATLADVKPGNYLHGKLRKEGGTEEFILDAKIEKEAPVRAPRGSGKMDKEKPAVTPAAPATEESTDTNAPAKKKKKATATP